MDTFGSRLKKAREAAGLNQTQLADMAHVNKMTVSSLENGKNKSPTPENLFNIADALHCNARWLATGKGEMRGAEGERPRLKVSSERLAILLDALPEAKRHEMIKLAEQLVKIEAKMKAVVDS